MKTKEFKLAADLHQQMAIQAHDMTRAECQLMRAIITNNYMPSDDYKLCRPAGVFLQGYQEPYDDKADGWILVEFWERDMAKIQACVEHINKRFADTCLKCFMPKRIGSSESLCCCEGL